MARKILVVDDEAPIVQLLSKVVEDMGYEPRGAANGREALARLGEDDYALVFTDLTMPVMDGRAFLEKAREEHPGVPVVVVTAHGDVESAIEVMRLGAADLVIKPFEAAQIKIVLERLVKQQEIAQENLRLKEVLRHSSPDPSLVGEDVAMRKVYQLIEKVAPTDATVLIQGESGTGKELVARTVHRRSNRDPDTFLAVNCAALAENLLESEIFGHEAGSFTGAVKKKIGLMEVARGGTLFLDEIAETAPSFQAKLLRALQEKEFFRLGGTRPIKVDVRILAATNKDLKQEIADGRFREDLFYRLNVFPIVLPPLRERTKDIHLLVDRFLSEFGGGKVSDGACTDEAMRIFTRYLWPGNVRELRNAVERACILSGGDPIAPEHIPQEILDSQRPEAALTRLVELPLNDAKDQLEARYLNALMQKFGGNVSRAAEHAGIGRGTLHDKLNRQGIDPGDYRNKD